MTGTAAALALQPELVKRDDLAMPPPVADREPTPVEFQPSLFRDLSGGPKVVPIPTLTPLRPASPLDRDSVRRNAARAIVRSSRGGKNDSQQQFDLREQGDVQHRPEETIYCDARVALPTQRTIAAAIDGGFVMLGVGFFLVGAYAADVDFGLLGNLVVLPAAMAAVILVLYRGLWALVNRDTPGMRFAGLRLVDFDGRTPKRDRRILRQFAGLLSLVSAGVGLAWALVDEENLTWHDHISRTFPTTV
jgi:uncharacterized RDD family membrane protein YckC